MKIVSKFRDYYDGVQGMYRDDHPLYIRKNISLEIKNPFNRRSFKIGRIWVEDKEYMYKEFVVGFCGKIYYGVEVELSRTSWGNLPEKHVFYDMEKLNCFLNIYQSSSKWKDEFIKSNNGNNYRWKQAPKFISRRDEILEDKSLLGIFTKHSVPSFVIDLTLDQKEILSLNHELKKYEFYKQFDSYTAFQELDMYIGNDLAQSNDPSMPVGGDVVVAESKGFNKFSFRKDKSKKGK
jgi:hypothetical protein